MTQRPHSTQPPSSSRTFILAMDQGTTSSRSVLFDPQGRVHALAQRPLTLHTPHPGWVEHDPLEMVQTQLTTAREALAQAQVKPGELAALGITNQRETCLLWHTPTGRPLHRALVWQDRRTANLCQQWLEQGLDRTDWVQRSGLRLDPYFSASKWVWLLNQVPEAKELAARGELSAGTIDSWLIWNLTEGRVHATDVTNASRTLLWDLHAQRWSPEALDALNLPAGMLPTAQPSAHEFGVVAAHVLGHAVPILGVAGDQQAALLGQGCIQPGMAKNTYGTGCFLLMHAGHTPVPTQADGLLCTATAEPTSPNDTRCGMALEGSVFMGGAVVQWLRDGLNAIRHSHEVEALARQVDDSGGVMLVPAFTGLGAPHWRPDARAALVGMTRGTGLPHIARAALESIAWQCADVVRAMNQRVQAAGGTPLTELRVDGGASANDLLMQIQADALGLPVVRAAHPEATALGAARLAGWQAGVMPLTAPTTDPAPTRFEPRISDAQRQNQQERWQHALRQTLAP